MRSKALISRGSGSQIESPLIPKKLMCFFTSNIRWCLHWYLGSGYFFFVARGGCESRKFEQINNWGDFLICRVVLKETNITVYIYIYIFDILDLVACLYESVGFSGTPNSGTTYPYYSHTTPISIWVPGYHFRGSHVLGIPGESSPMNRMRVVEAPDRVARLL